MKIGERRGTKRPVAGCAGSAFDRPSQVEDSFMPFYGESSKRSNRVLDQDLQLEEEVMQALRKAKQRTFRRHKEHGALHLKRLRKDLPEDKDREHVQEVLHYWTSQMLLPKEQRNSKLPTLGSVKQFCHHFNWIAEALEKSKDSKELPSTELGQKVLQRLRNLRWSGASPESLAQAVEKSLANYVPFYQRCKKYLRETIPKGAYISSDNYFYMLWMRVFRAPEDFVEQWFRARHIALVTWSAWNGSFAKEVFHPEHPRFTFMVRKESINYGATEKRIKELVEKLK